MNQSHGVTHWREPAYAGATPPITAAVWVETAPGSGIFDLLTALPTTSAASGLWASGLWAPGLWAAGLWDTGTTARLWASGLWAAGLWAAGLWATGGAPGSPATATLVSDGVGGYDLSATDLTGTGRVMVVGTIGGIV